MIRNSFHAAFIKYAPKQKSDKLIEQFLASQFVLMLFKDIINLNYSLWSGMLISFICDAEFDLRLARRN